MKRCLFQSYGKNKDTYDFKLNEIEKRYVQDVKCTEMKREINLYRKPKKNVSCDGPHDSADDNNIKEREGTLMN